MLGVKQSGWILKFISQHVDKNLRGLGCPLELPRYVFPVLEFQFNCCGMKIRGVCYPSPVSFQMAVEGYHVALGKNLLAAEWNAVFHTVISWVPFPSCGKEWLRGKRSRLTSNHRREEEPPPMPLGRLCFIPHPVGFWGIRMWKGVISF